MSLRVFHIVFITVSVALMLYLDGVGRARVHGGATARSESR